jgi:tetratricopeptide (TPR) repeat protein
MAENDIQTLFRRAELLLEDGEWVRATSCYNNILDIEPENAKAHIGLLLAALRIKSEDELKTCPEMFDDNKNYLRAVEFADDEYKVVLQNYCVENIKFNAEEIIKNAKKADDYEAAIDILLKISEQVDVSERIKILRGKKQRSRFKQKE